MVYVLSRLAKEILEAYETGGFVGAVVYGKQGAGKSQYSMLVSYEVFGNWYDVLAHMVFPLWHFLEMLEPPKKRLIIWDDAGLHASKYLYFLEEIGIELAKGLQGLFQVIRTKTSGLILTATSPKMLLKSIRKQEGWYIIKIIKGTGDLRYAKVYRHIELPNGFSYTKLAWIEKFRINKIPKWVLDIYYPMRDRYADYAKMLLEKVIEKLFAMGIPVDPVLEEMRQKILELRDKHKNK